MGLTLTTRDFPDDPVVKNPPSNAEDEGLIPGWGTKIPHLVEQLSLCSTTTEAHSLWSLQATPRESVCRNERSHVTGMILHVQLGPSAAKSIN